MIGIAPGVHEIKMCAQNQVIASECLFSGGCLCEVLSAANRKQSGAIQVVKD